MKNKVIAVFFSFALVLTGYLPYGRAIAKAMDGSEIFFEYINHGNHIEITGPTTPYIRDRNGHFSYGMTIPEEIDGLPVTEIAEGGLSGIRMRQMIWPEWITSIPANCFQNCKTLETIILPDTLEQIDANAFDGCSRLRDVLYKGDDVEWDALSVGTGNAPLQQAHILTNYNRSNGRDTEFVFGEDNFSFKNGDLTEYLLNTESVEYYLEGCHPETIENNSKLLHAGREYEGACGGFALASYMVCCGILEPSDIYEGAETLHDIPMCQEAVEAVCYYWQQSIGDDLYTARTDEMKVEYIESGQFLSDLEQGKPVYLGYFIPCLGGHAVVAYGVEQGEWQYNQMTYKNRLLIYDNNMDGFTDKACIYYNGDLEDMYVPYWDERYQSGKYDKLNISNWDPIIGFGDVFWEPDRIPYGIRTRTIYEPTYKAGDLDKDESVNAVDAAEILTAAASVGSGSDSGLNNGQQYAADVNADGELNAVDAALVLQYAAYVGAGYKGSLMDFLTESEMQSSFTI